LTDSRPLEARDLSWPIRTIDFEASSLHKLSYPIEIAISQWNGPDDPTGVTWHTLIGETADWRAKGLWSEDSQRIHGIDRAALVDAPEPSLVMAQANRFAPVGSVAFCDGGSYDSFWMQRLADAAGRRPAVLLGSFAHLLSFLDDEQTARIVSHHSERKIAHRAAPDAEQHIQCLAFAMGLREPRFTRIGII
jgi:hypothetical protein